jgi:hypothetical protein
MSLNNRRRSTDEPSRAGDKYQLGGSAVLRAICPPAAAASQKSSHLY